MLAIGFGMLPHFENEARIPVWCDLTGHRFSWHGHDPREPSSAVSRTMINVSPDSAGGEPQDEDLRSLKQRLAEILNRVDVIEGELADPTTVPEDAAALQAEKERISREALDVMWHIDELEEPEDLDELEDLEE